MRRRPGSQMQREMRRLVGEAQQQYRMIKAENLPSFLSRRFETGNERYGIPRNSLATQQAKVKQGKPPTPLVDSGLLAQAARFSRWAVTATGSLVARLPSYFSRIQAQYNVLGLTVQERKELLRQLRARLHNRR